MRYTLMLGLLLVGPLYGQTKVDVQSEVAAAQAAATSGDTAQARFLYEAAIRKIDAPGYENTLVMDELDAVRERVLRAEMYLAASIPDVQWLGQLASRLRREHPNGRVWIQASQALAERTGQGAAEAQALMAQEMQADTAYRAAKRVKRVAIAAQARRENIVQLVGAEEAKKMLTEEARNPKYDLVKHLKETCARNPFSDDALQQIRTLVTPHLNESCSSALLCQRFLAISLIDRGELEEGVGLLTAVAARLLPAYGSMMNRGVRDRLFEVAIPAIEKIADKEKALALCKAILAVQEGGNEQNLTIREREEAVRVRLLFREVILATALNRQADVLEALGKMETWFPTDEHTIEANRIVTKTQGQDSSRWLARLEAETQARVVLDPLLANFRDWSSHLQQKGTDPQSAVVGQKYCAAAIAYATGQFPDTDTAINALVEVGSRMAGGGESSAEAFEMLSTAQTLLGKRTGWVAFKCWDSMSEIFLYRRDQSLVTYCDAVLASDPLVLRQLDANLKKAIVTRLSQPDQSIQYAEAGLSLFDKADESVWRMIGWDCMAMLKSTLLLTKAMALPKTDPSAVSGLLEVFSKELQGVSDANASTRDLLKRRAAHLRRYVTASRPSEAAVPRSAGGQ